MSDKKPNPLVYEQKNAYTVLDKSETDKAYAFAEEYKGFINAAKTERESAIYAENAAKKAGFTPLDNNERLTPGSRVYRNFGGKLIMLAVIGKSGADSGFNIAAAHIDAPRLDLKQLPLYESEEVAYFKTHYYGGIKKFQWVTLPLAIHGYCVRADGSSVAFSIGENEDEPAFFISDLLPHLGKDQLKKTLAEAFTGESLNLIVGTSPSQDADAASKYKLRVLEILSEKYGITEEDFLSSEIEVVPAGRARDAGFDGSLIGAYGHDDRVCAYPALSALLSLSGTPDKTAVVILADKEEIGSEGVSGMQSRAFERFTAELLRKAGSRLDLDEAYERSFCLSTDVCNALDPSFMEVSEKINAAKLNHGIGILKFTGSGGKSSSSDASAETVAKVRALFRENGVLWQMGELGKVDQGGGGTVAKYMANRNIQTIDAGVPVLSMHAPWELIAKLDLYMTYKAILALFSGQ
ncbi:MAG: aminopeptidase [Oscillospiraceae bacterium]|nr:aminopeptidase [Oscillospiraceae bacterium]